MLSILIVQVGERKSCYCSDELGLVVLPCPHTVFQCACDCVSVIKLLLCLSGDVEENPGPTTDKMFSEMKKIIESQKEILNKVVDRQQDILKTVTEVREKQNSADASFKQLETRLSTIEGKLSDVGETRKTVQALENEVCNLHSQMRSLTIKFDNLENRSRKNNLIVRGIKEVEHETEHTLLNNINENIFQGILGAKAETIERMHRLGMKQTNRDRPVIITFKDHKEKAAIMKNCHKLKGSKISVSDDYSKRLLEIPKNLLDSAAEEKKQGAKIKLLYDKLKVNTTTYSWDENTQSRYKCHASPSLPINDAEGNA